MQPNLSYDAAALKEACVKQHGAELGEMVFAAKVAQRQAEDARCIVWEAELLELNRQLSAIAAAAAAQRLKSKAALESAFAAYRTLCGQAAIADELAQSPIAPLQSKALEIQRQISAIALSRSAERELRNVMIYNSTDSTLLRHLDAELPPLASPPPSALAQINSNVGREPRF